MEDEVMQSLLSSANYIQDSIIAITKPQKTYSMRDIEEKIDYFDSMFLKVYNFLPFSNSFNSGEIEKVITESVQSHQQQKEKIFKRYLKEIAQIGQRIEKIHQKIELDEHKFETFIRTQQDQLQEGSELLLADFRSKMAHIRSIHNSKILAINRDQEILRSNFNNFVAQREEELNSQHSVLASSKTTKKVEIEQTIQNVLSDIQEKSDDFARRVSKLNEVSENRRKLILLNYETLYSEIEGEMEDILKKILSSEEKSKSFRERAEALKKAFPNRLAAAIAAIRDNHALIARQKNLQVEETRKRLADIDDLAHRLDATIASTHFDTLASIESKLKAVLKERETRLKEIADRAEIEKTESISRSRLLIETIENEAEINFQKANKEIQKAEKEASERLTLTREKRVLEQEQLNRDITRTLELIESAKKEWASLKEATIRIYNSRIFRVEESIRELKARNKVELEEFLTKKPSTIDSQEKVKAIYKEIPLAAERFKQFEALLREEGMRQGLLRIEDERTRGDAAGRRPLVDELLRVREEESQLKALLSETIEKEEEEKTRRGKGREEVISQKFKEDFDKFKTGFNISQLQYELSQCEERLREAKLSRQAALGMRQVIEANLREMKKNREKKEMERKLTEEEKLAGLEKMAAERDSDRERVNILTERINKAKLEREKMTLHLTSLHELHSRLREDFVNEVENGRKAIENLYLARQAEIRDTISSSMAKWTEESKLVSNQINQIMAGIGQKNNILRGIKEDVDRNLRAKQEGVLYETIPEDVAYEEELKSKLTQLKEQNRLKETELAQLGRANMWEKDDERRRIEDEREAQLEQDRIKASELEKELARMPPSICNKCVSIEDKIIAKKNSIKHLIQSVSRAEAEQLSRSYQISHFG